MAWWFDGGYVGDVHASRFTPRVASCFKDGREENALHVQPSTAIGVLVKYISPDVVVVEYRGSVCRLGCFEGLFCLLSLSPNEKLSEVNLPLEFSPGDFKII